MSFFITQLCVMLCEKKGFFIRITNNKTEQGTNVKKGLDLTSRKQMFYQKLNASLYSKDCFQLSGS